MAQVASYFAKVGVDVDTSAFARVDKYFNMLEKRMNKLANSSKSFQIPLKITIDHAKSLAYVQKSLNIISKSVVLKISKLDINTRSAIRDLNHKLSLSRGSATVSINAVISSSSIRNMQAQIRSALSGMTISPNITPRVSSPRVTGSARNSGGGNGGSSARGVMPWLRGDTGWSPGASMAMLGRGVPAFVAAYAGLKGLSMNNQAIQQNYAQTTAMDTLFANAIQPDGSTVDLRRQANAVLMNHVNQVGLDLKAVRPEFTNFMAASMPSIGFQQSADAFKAFTTFGMVRGADSDSIQRALKAIGQMAGKGQVYAEELKQQLGDASGFGEMLPIFAQAYQESLHGQGSAQNLVGQKAISALLAAMKKGSVKTEDVLPIVARIANERSAPGMAAIANSPGAQQNRASTAATAWVDAFSQGGGAEGWARFWTMITESIQDSTKYAKTLGRYFDIAVTSTKYLKDSWDDLLASIRGEKDISEDSLFAGIIDSDTQEALRSVWNVVKDLTKDIKQMFITAANQENRNVLVTMFQEAVKWANLFLRTLDTVAAGLNLLNSPWSQPGGWSKAWDDFKASAAATGAASDLIWKGWQQQQDIGRGTSPAVGLSTDDARRTMGYDSVARPNTVNQYNLGSSVPMGSVMRSPPENTIGAYAGREGGTPTMGGGFNFSGTQYIDVNVQNTNASAQDIADKIREAQQNSYHSVLSTGGGSKPR